MSLPRLSPELYDRIIDEVAESVTRSRKDTTLSALALTCREWLPRVRYNRWNRVAWLSDLRERRLLALVTLIDAVPEIAPYIKTMELAIKAYVRRPYRKREAAGQSIFVIGPTDDPHAPVGLDATIRKNATSEEICQAFFPKLINLVYLEFNSPILPVTPRLVCHLSKLRVLVLVKAILRSWQNLQGVLRALPDIRKIFFVESSYARNRNLPPESGIFQEISSPTDVDNIAPYLDEIGVMGSPNIILDFHRILLAGTQRSSVIDLSVGETSLIPGQFRKVFAERERFMLTIHPACEESGFVPGEVDELYMDVLDHSIRLNEVELIPDWDTRSETALSSMFSWLGQITRAIEVLVLRLYVPAMEVLQSEDWIKITELLRSRFTGVEQLVVRFLLIHRRRTPGEPLPPKTSAMASDIERQLGPFAQSGKLRFECTEYCYCWDASEDHIVWRLVERSERKEENKEEEQ